MMCPVPFKKSSVGQMVTKPGGYGLNEGRISAGCEGWRAEIVAEQVSCPRVRTMLMLPATGSFFANLVRIAVLAEESATIIHQKLGFSCSFYVDWVEKEGSKTQLERLPCGQAIA